MLEDVAEGEEGGLSLFAQHRSPFECISFCFGDTLLDITGVVDYELGKFQLTHLV